MTNTFYFWQNFTTMSIASFFESGERKQDKGHLKNLVLIANVDGHVSDEELVLIHRIGRKIGLTNTQIGQILDDPSSIQVFPPVGREERYGHMIDMVHMMQADGVVDDKEMKMIGRFAVQIGFKSIDDVNVEDILSELSEGKSNEEILTSLGF